jgi:hypothetical protein
VGICKSINNGVTWTVPQEYFAPAGTGPLDATNGSSQGYSVCFQSPSLLAVGGPFCNNGSGATWIWERSDDTWSIQSKIVTPNEPNSLKEIGRSSQGFSVSYLGNILASGGPSDTTASNNVDTVGAAWTFSNPGQTGQTENKLIGTESAQPTVYASQGSAVALGTYTFGNTGSAILVSGGPNDNNDGGPGDLGVGAVWTWTTSDSGATWLLQQNELVGSEAIGYSAQGSSLAMVNTSNGTILVVGGPGDNDGNGAVWIFDQA